LYDIIIPTFFKYKSLIWIINDDIYSKKALGVITLLSNLSTHHLN